MKITSYIFFTFYAIICIAHLTFCYLNLEKPRKVTKCFCLPILAIAIACYSPKSYLIYIGALFGAIGDYFLIYKEKPKMLFFGILSFYIGHWFYSAQIMIWMAMPKWGVILYVLLEFVLALILSLILHPKMENKYNKATVPGIAYFTLLGSTLGLSIIGSIITKSWLPGLLLSIGYAIFVSSDTILLYTAFTKKWKRDDFFIMLTYLSAQLLITLGLVFAFIGI